MGGDLTLFQSQLNYAYILAPHSRPTLILPLFDELGGEATGLALHRKHLESTDEEEELQVPESSSTNSPEEEATDQLHRHVAITITLLSLLPCWGRKLAASSGQDIVGR